MSGRKHVHVPASPAIPGEPQAQTGSNERRYAAPPDQTSVAGASPQPDQPVYSYQQKYTRCHKPACKRCTDGPGHGPYWYAFWWEGGRTRSRYIGKTRPPEVPDLERHASGADVPSDAPLSVTRPLLRVVTLGRFRVWRDDREIAETAWVRRKALALFKLLLGAPLHRLPREQVLDWLWPDTDLDAAGVALRGAVHAARRALDLPGGDTLLQVRNGVIALADAMTVEIDADVFAAEASAALAGPDIATCRAALSHYGGDYLPDDRYEDWAVERREELATLRITLLLHLADICGEAGDLAEARDALAMVLAIDPAHEAAACRQMTLLAAMGERTEALRIFEQLRSALRQEYDLEPGQEVRDLAARLRARHYASVVQHSQPAMPRTTNLPAASSPFIGRETAQNALWSLLQSARLVTLTGAGGSGKTRLATHVAASLLGTYPDGVWLCELAGLTPVSARTGPESTADPVPAALAGSLGLLEDPGCSLTETICGFLEPRRLLLVLDNAEHVLDPVAHLISAILARCSGVTLLVTSREALGLVGESVWAVPPLGVPDAGQRCTPEELQAYDAIRLFVARARSAHPTFSLNEATAPLVQEICHRLDGIPLAIELATARLAFLSLETLAARLDDRFRLLVGGSRVALPRQQTLRATMDWSYSLLGVRERTLLRRLTVFAGGWTLAAAEGVCADEELPEETILDALGGLVAKSLVARIEASEPPDSPESSHATALPAQVAMRYAMLETVREFGQLKLAETHEAAVLRLRHLAWFTLGCEAAIASWSVADQGTLLRNLDTELENIRSALAWGLGSDAPAVAAIAAPDEAPAALALRLASSLSRYWDTRGLVREGRRWIARALDAAPEAPTTLRATALNRCAILARMEGDNAGAGTLWQASLALFRLLEDTAGVARVMVNLGLLHYDLGDDASAVAAWTESLALMRRLADQRNVADALLNLGMVYTRQRRYAQAEACLAEAGAIWQATGNQAGVGNTLLHAGHLARDQEQPERAIQLYTQSVRTSVALGDRYHLPPALEGIANVLLHGPAAVTHQHETCVLCTYLLACAAALRESTGVAVHIAHQDIYYANLHLLQMLLGAETFEAAWSEGWEMPVLDLIERLPS